MHLEKCIKKNKRIEQM